MSATYSFLPWVRQGAISAVQEPETLDAGLNARAALPVGLQLSTSDRVDVQLRLNGPGDVVAIDARQVVRTEPRPGTSSFPPSYFAAVEFDRPDFPWLFTPARAEAQQGKLRPWLVLVVVRKQDGVTLGSQGGPLPVLDIRSPAVAAAELPDLSESWAWAHAQALHDGTSLQAVLEGDPARTVSRLLSPRRLRPRSNYWACVVPAFEVGLKAGLGFEVTADDEKKLAPAWGSGDNAPFDIKLPVYYHWTFATGEEGDFEAAVRSLQPLRQLPEKFASRRLHVGNGGIPTFPDLETLDYSGVFRVPGTNPPILPQREAMTETQRVWVDQLSRNLNYAADTAAGVSQEAIVTNPIYGSFQQALTRLPDANGWVRDLNLEARNRAAAGLGVLFIQHNQEDLMASAWDQLGDASQAQQLVQRDELSREVGNAAFTRRFVPMKGRGEMLFQMTSPAHPKLCAEMQQTVAAWSDERSLAKPATLAAFRRLARPGGPVARRLRAAGPKLTAPITVQFAQPGASTAQPLQTFILTVAQRLTELKNRRNHWLLHAGDKQAASRASIAIDALTPHLERIAALSVPPPLQAQTFGASMQDALLRELSPEVSVGSRIQARFGALEEPAQTLPHPRFAQPMYEAVRDLMPGLFQAGADGLPDNTVALLETNPAFIEAFMVGLNHEMSRELLWRGYPTDRLGTCFRHFWGTTAEANETRQPDMPEIHKWAAASRLGTNLTDGHVAGQLVLVLRSDLLRRFPGTAVYAVRAKADGSLGIEEKPPVQRGVIADDAVFLLFDLTKAQARGGPDGDGSPGWFFVLQEQPTEPRFGLDATPAAPRPSQWADVAWDHVVTNAGGYLQVGASAASLTSVNEPDGPAWGFNGAHMADIALQRPFRIAIHARRLL